MEQKRENSVDRIRVPIDRYQFSYRTSADGVVVKELGSDGELRVLWSKKEAFCFLYSWDGKYLALVVAEKSEASDKERGERQMVWMTSLSTRRWVEILDVERMETVKIIDDVQGVEEHLYWSPNNRYLVTWQPLSSNRSGEVGEQGEERNVKIWRIHDGKKVMSWKSANRQCWPMFRWTDDEKVAARWKNGQIEVYDWQWMVERGEENGVEKCVKLACIGISDWSLSKRSLAVFLPERSGHPAKVFIYGLNVPVSKSEKSDVQLVSSVPMSTASFFRADEVKFMWHFRGQALLVFARTKTDTTGKAYYGETFLYYLSADGKYTTGVSLEKEGPIHDVQWNPNGHDFTVTYGFMPSKTTLFNRKCKALGHLGLDPRNKVIWNPHGRILCLGGFGQLPGEMDFWDTVKLVKLGSAVSYCSGYHEWTPDGKYLISAVTWPRMRVDNRYEIFDVKGRCIVREPCQEMWKIQWRPVPNCLPAYASPPTQDIVVQEPVRLCESTKPESSLKSFGDGSSQKVGKSTGSADQAQNSGGAYRHPNWSKTSDASCNGAEVPVASETLKRTIVGGTKKIPKNGNNRPVPGGKPKNQKNNKILSAQG
ncbi:uncharacterized protein LOC126318601 [Schistocerca gregaria]|uniref:uncharacterized protein LOC126318601 n=1 Tax=Schistocerca gregaria TaxID=7010 RepID=UPI00211F2898|nr:uncharacterized protein LOC126318601 [Schistocerca gregaria]